MIGEDGIFNAPFLSKQREVIFVESALDALTLIQHDFPHTTFPFGSDAKYLKFAQDQGIRAVTFTFEGRARLFAGPLRLERPSADRERPDPDHRRDREAPRADRPSTADRDGVAEELRPGRPDRPRLHRAWLRPGAQEQAPALPSDDLAPDAQPAACDHHLAQQRRQEHAGGGV